MDWLAWPTKNVIIGVHVQTNCGQDSVRLAGEMVSSEIFWSSPCACPGPFSKSSMDVAKKLVGQFSDKSVDVGDKNDPDHSIDKVDGHRLEKKSRWKTVDIGD